MKLTAIILLAACLQVSAKTDAQSVSINLTRAPLEKVFQEIKRQTGYSFFYEGKVLDDTKKVTLNVRNASVEDVLKMTFEGQLLTYTIIEKTVVVKRSGPTTNLNINSKEGTKPPPIDVRGRVVNEAGEPVAGASVIVKSTNQGTNTNGDGYFELRNVDDNATLVISAVNIEPYEVRVNGRRDLATIGVRMKVTAQEEVIVKTNYWETKQRLNPGNISKVNAKEIERQPVSNPLAALQANVPGLEITQMTGVPGGGFRVRIRGTNSIANGNDPLYVIDGVPYTSTPMSFDENAGGILGNASAVFSEYGSSPLNNINPLDIESIEILKDADATAIYGSRGANGVILITMKKGKPGSTKVDFNFYTGNGKVGKRMNLLNTQQYLQMRREAFSNDNIIPNSSNAPDLLIWDSTWNTDWQKELIGGNAIYTDAQLSFSGGDNNTLYLIRGGYHRETTVFPGDNSDRRISANVNISNTSINNKLRTSLSFNYTSSFTDILSLDLTNRAITLSPNAPPLYNVEGDINWEDWEDLENPLAYIKRKYEATTNNLIGNLSLIYSILPGLDIKGNFGYTRINMDAIQTRPISSFHPASVWEVNNSIFSNSNFQNWIIEPQVNWNRKIGKGRINILTGTTFLSQQTDGLAQYADGFSSEALMKNIAAAPNIYSATNYYSQYKYNAAFGRFNYSFNERYVINISGRRDGSSRFGPNKQFANFGAIGLAWIFSEEDFIQQTLPFISNGKVRTSYGTSGNDQIGDYQYLDTYSPDGSGNYQGNIGLNPLRLFNPNFAWEKIRKYEIGLDLGLIDNKIMFGLSYYNNISSNQLIGFPLSSTTGFNSIQDNFPATVQNTGIEIEFSSKNIEKKSFSWTTSLNLSIPRNKLIDFPDIESFPAYANTYVVGQPLSIRKFYNFLQVNPVSGIYQFEDVDGNGRLDIQDRQSIKFNGKYFFGGIQNNIQFKNFHLNFLFQFVKQTGYNYTGTFYNMPGTMINQPANVLGRWKIPGDNKDIQKFSTGNDAYVAYSSLIYSSNSAVADASFIRLKNLALTWNLPDLLIKKIAVQSASFFIQGQNLLTITKYLGLDPEIRGDVLPALRVITGGFQLTL